MVYEILETIGTIGAGVGLAAMTGNYFYQKYVVNKRLKDENSYLIFWKDQESKHTQKDAKITDLEDKLRLAKVQAKNSEGIDKMNYWSLKALEETIVPKDEKIKSYARAEIDRIEEEIQAEPAPEPSALINIYNRVKIAHTDLAESASMLDKAIVAGIETQVLDLISDELGYLMNSGSIDTAEPLDSSLAFNETFASHNYVDNHGKEITPGVYCYRLSTQEGLSLRKPIAEIDIDKLRDWLEPEHKLQKKYDVLKRRAEENGVEVTPEILKELAKDAEVDPNQVELEKVVLDLMMKNDPTLIDGDSL